MSAAPQEATDNDSVRAVDRALDILLAFRPGESQLSAAELLRRVDLSRPTLYRLLRTLQARGFVVANGQPQRFGLGPSVAQLTHAWSSGQDFVERARPVMQALWEATGETVALMVHTGHERVCVAELPSPQPLSFRRGVGHRNQVLLGASGRAIVAFVPEPSAYLAALPHKKRAAYAQELERIRQEGYAVSREELIAGAVAMAVPVLSAEGEVQGSLAVYGPSARIGEAQIRRMAKLLLQAGEQLRQSGGPARSGGRA